jgi:hypothetical protein
MRSRIHVPDTCTSWQQWGKACATRNCQYFCSLVIPRRPVIGQKNCRPFHSACLLAQHNRHNRCPSRINTSLTTRRIAIFPGAKTFRTSSCRHREATRETALPARASSPLTRIAHSNNDMNATQTPLSSSRRSHVRLPAKEGASYFIHRFPTKALHSDHPT